MALNRVTVSLEDTTIANVAEIAAKNGKSFDETMEQLLQTNNASAPASAPAAKKTAAKSRK